MPEFNWVYTAIIIAAVVAGVQGYVAYLILLERKVAAWVQDRIGPNRVGPLGLLQPIADGGKMFLKEDVIPNHVDKVFFVLAPIVSFSTAMLAIAVVPLGSTVAPPAPQATVAAFEAAQADYASHYSFVVVPGLDIGILYTFAIGSLAVYGVILAGWSANNKFSLLGALRSSAQIISYEIPLGLSIVGVLLFTGSLNLESMIAWQNGGGHTWNIFYQPLAFLIFMTSIYAECNRLPFDLPEAEQELVGGYHTEYSNSMKLGLMLLAEYAHMITTSFLMSIVFFGGWGLFGVEELGRRPGRERDREVGNFGRQDDGVRGAVLARPLDDSALPVRPTDEPGVEGDDAAGAIELGLRASGAATECDAVGADGDFFDSVCRGGAFGGAERRAEQRAAQVAGAAARRSAAGRDVRAAVAPRETRHRTGGITWRWPTTT